MKGVNDFDDDDDVKLLNSRVDISILISKAGGLGTSICRAGLPRRDPHMTLCMAQAWVVRCS